jgi:hypothetical protein
MGMLSRKIDQLQRALEGGKLFFKEGNPVIEEFARDLSNSTVSATTSADS